MLVGDQTRFSGGIEAPITTPAEVDYPINLSDLEAAQTLEVQIRTSNQVNSSEPYYKASITLDQNPPQLPGTTGLAQPCQNVRDCESSEQCVSEQCVPAAILIDNGALFTNSELGLGHSFLGSSRQYRHLSNANFSKPRLRGPRCSTISLFIDHQHSSGPPRSRW